MKVAGVELSAKSFRRYRASAAERRLHGGATITEFYVMRHDTKQTALVSGYGPTPGGRKTDAMRRAARQWGLSE